MVKKAMFNPYVEIQDYMLQNTKKFALDKKNSAHRLRSLISSVNQSMVSTLYSNIHLRYKCLSTYQNSKSPTAHLRSTNPMATNQ